MYPEAAGAEAWRLKIAMSQCHGSSDQLLIGASGAAYTYFQANGKIWSKKTTAGNVAFIGMKPDGGFDVLYVAEAENGNRLGMPAFPQPESNYEATLRLFRRNDDADARRREVLDLIARYEPIKNRPAGVAPPLTRVGPRPVAPAVLQPPPPVDPALEGTARGSQEASPHHDTEARGDAADTEFTVTSERLIRSASRQAPYAQATVSRSLPRRRRSRTQDAMGWIALVAFALVGAAWIYLWQNAAALNP